jgi:hypothetical protein
MVSDWSSFPLSVISKFILFMISTLSSKESAYCLCSFSSLLKLSNITHLLKSALEISYSFTTFFEKSFRSGKFTDLKQVSATPNYKKVIKRLWIIIYLSAYELNNSRKILRFIIQVFQNCLLREKGEYLSKRNNLNFKDKKSYLKR